MINTSHLLTLAIFTWLGMIAFPAFGLFIHASEGPAVEMECPDYVWDMIKAGTLDVTESDETMKRNNCEYVFPEEEPFNPTNWFLFGIVTGFAVGAMVTRKAHSTMVTASPPRGSRTVPLLQLRKQEPVRMPLSGLRGRRQRKRIPQAGRSPRDGPATQIWIPGKHLQSVPAKRLGKRRGCKPEWRTAGKRLTHLGDLQEPASG